MGRKKVLVINPNSNRSVTDALRCSLHSSESVVDCCTLHNGPFGIESDSDIDCVKPLLIEKIRAAKHYDAYVIACYSDAGLGECRETFSKPVFGMQQSAVETAVAQGGKFGVLALSDQSIQRHLPYIRALGFADKLAAELPLDVSVDAAANDPATLNKIIAQGSRLIHEFGANTLILGCAGMAAHREAAATALGVIVIEPTQAALDLAIAA